MKLFFILMAIIPATGFLTVSFFVLYAAAKAEHPGLKSFASVVVVLLCLCAALVLTGGIVRASKGGPMSWGPGMMMHHMMDSSMDKDMDKEKTMEKTQGMDKTK